MLTLYPTALSGDFTLEEQIEWLSAVVHSINDGILVIDQREIVRLINPEYTRITGVLPERIIGKRLREVRPSAQLPDTLKDGKSRGESIEKRGIQNMS